ncbi:hypothetical protein [Methylobacterium gossipiicola]|uniref:hypothetical protein n=1 Tax=Methylobacterium gossipiicola TaxID=582675 RepID=UPI0011602676|nr:hypothetical protein [Methylobacterium gossipiicola]
MFAAGASLGDRVFAIAGGAGSGERTLTDTRRSDNYNLNSRNKFIYSMFVVLFSFGALGDDKNRSNNNNEPIKSINISDNLKIVTPHTTRTDAKNNAPFPEDKIGIYGDWTCKSTKKKKCTTDDGFNGTVIGPITDAGVRVRIISYGYHVSYLFDAIAIWDGNKLTASDSSAQLSDEDPCVIDFMFSDDSVKNKPVNIEPCFLYGPLGNKDKIITHSLTGAQ